MKQLLTAAAFLCIIGVLRADDKTEKKAEIPVAKIGVYDSRCVAYAHFWTDEHQKKMTDLYNKTKAAKKAGNKEEYEKLDKVLWANRQRSHSQVFSTTPIDDVMETIKDRLPEMKKKAGVSELLSKWDEEKLKKYTSAEKVDVTDLLMGQFKFPSTEKHKKVLDAMKNVKPVPLDQVDKIE
jgi:hypothetical protein